MSATGAISTLVWALIVIIIIIVVVVVLFKVINLLFIAPQVSATFTAYAETVRGFSYPIRALPSLTPILKLYFSLPFFNRSNLWLS